jgi:hypothetical protein
MKCKHKREMYYENRICRDCVEEREKELLDALKNVRNSLNMETDYASIVEFLDGVLDDKP